MAKTKQRAPITDRMAEVNYTPAIQSVNIAVVDLYGNTIHLALGEHAFEQLRAQIAQVPPIMLSGGV